MTQQPGIYAITHELSGKMYIGSAVNLRRRLYRHRLELVTNKHHNSRLQRAWNKYGADAFKFETLLICSKDNLVMYEQLCIDGYDSVRSGYNLCPTAGSPAGVPCSEETRAKLRQARLGTKQSDAHRELNRQTKLGKKKPPRTAQHRANISAAQTGKKRSPFSEKARKNMSEGQKRRGPRSSETIDRMRIAAKLREAKKREFRETVL